MNSTGTKIQKVSEKVLEILTEKGLSKIFNYEDYNYFKKECKNAQNRAEAIAEKFIFWNSHELSDFADYDF